MIIEVLTGFFWNVFMMLIAPYLLWRVWDYLKGSKWF